MGQIGCLGRPDSARGLPVDDHCIRRINGGQSELRIKSLLQQHHNWSVCKVLCFKTSCPKLTLRRSIFKEAIILITLHMNKEYTHTSINAHIRTLKRYFQYITGNMLSVSQLFYSFHACSVWRGRMQGECKVLLFFDAFEIQQAQIRKIHSRGIPTSDVQDSSTTTRQILKPNYVAR